VIRTHNAAGSASASSRRRVTFGPIRGVRHLAELVTEQAATPTLVPQLADASDGYRGHRRHHRRNHI
jgi:hypothetical protein